MAAQLWSGSFTVVFVHMTFLDFQKISGIKKNIKCGVEKKRGGGWTI